LELIKLSIFMILGLLNSHHPPPPTYFLIKVKFLHIDSKAIKIDVLWAYILDLAWCRQFRYPGVCKRKNPGIPALAILGLHFIITESCYTNNYREKKPIKFKLLKHDAIPLIFPNQPSYFTKKQNVQIA
jgi:hypothetical protein